MRFILILLFLACPAFAAEGGDEKTKLPPDVQKVVDAHDAEVAKAKAAYDAAVAKANDAATKAMEVVIKNKMKRQDLEGAMAAKAIVEKWQAEQPKGDDLLGDKPKVEEQPDQKNMVGVWTVGGNPFIFRADGTWSSPWANLGGTWKPTGKQITLTANKGNNGVYLVLPKNGENWSLNGSLGGTGGAVLKVSDKIPE